MNVISVDLDDTLISTHVQYDLTKEWFADLMSDKYDISQTEAKERYTEYSSRLIEEHGLSKHRFPKAAVEALRSIADDPTEEEERRAYEIGRSTFKNKDQYRKQGFIEDGVESFLETVSDLSDISVLLTAGDPDIQNRKVDALNIDQYFDEIEVVGMNGKTDALQLYADADNLIHVGNSNHSDVRAASAVNADCIYIPRGQWMQTDNQYTGTGNLHVVDNIREAEEIIHDTLGD